MSIEERDKLIFQRKDLIGLINDLERVSSKQENLVTYGQITEEEARNRIKKFKDMIQDNLKAIKELENKLEKNYSLVLRYY